MSGNWTPGPWRTDCWGNVSGGGMAITSAWTTGEREPHWRANATLIASAPGFAGIAARAQVLANERGGDYSALSHDELCGFMVEYDTVLAKARGEPA